MGRSTPSISTERQRAHLQAIAPLGGLARASRHDSAAMTAAGRRAFSETYFLDMVDPDRTLDEADRLRRASAAKKLHYVRMSYLSHKARKSKAAARKAASARATDLQSDAPDRPAKAGPKHDTRPAGRRITDTSVAGISVSDPDGGLNP